jgi:hypothetical protein
MPIMEFEDRSGNGGETRVKERVEAWIREQKAMERPAPFVINGMVADRPNTGFDYRITVFYE